MVGGATGSTGVGANVGPGDGSAGFGSNVGVGGICLVSIGVGCVEIGALAAP